MKTVDVVVGVIFDSKQGIYITQRGQHSHLAGYWEFPGGKVESDETPDQALQRELFEEVGIENISADLLDKTEHSYTDKTLTLYFYLVTQWDGIPHGREGQLGRWVAMSELDTVEFPEANRAIVAQLKADYA